MAKAGEPRFGTKRRSNFDSFDLDRGVSAGRVTPATIPFLDAVGEAMAEHDACGCEECRQAVMDALHACDDARGIRAPE